MHEGMVEPLLHFAAIAPEAVAAERDRGLEGGSALHNGPEEIGKVETGYSPRGTPLPQGDPPPSTLLLPLYPASPLLMLCCDVNVGRCWVEKEGLEGGREEAERRKRVGLRSNYKLA